MLLRFSLVFTVLFGLGWCQSITPRLVLCDWKKSGTYTQTIFRVEEIKYQKNGPYWTGYFSINSTEPLRKSDLKVQFKEPAKMAIKKWTTVYRQFEKNNYEYEYYIRFASVDNEKQPEIVKFIVKGLEICNIAKGSCGKRQIHHQALITRGTSTNPGDWPWHVAIFHATNLPSYKYVCGGTLISTNAILTAAICVKDDDQIIIPERIKVKLGLYNIWTPDKNTQEFRAYRVIVHPDYSPITYNNDIAIITIPVEVAFSSYIQPVCLWPNHLIDIKNSEGEIGHVVGWGVNENDDLVDVLNHARMPVVSHIECIKSDRDFYANYISRSNYCAGFRNGTSVCKGDSGGGMFFEKDNIYSIRGIASLAKGGLKNICDTSEYVIFTDIAQYLDWIQKVLTN